MKLRITTDNDAFQDGNGPAEVARILRHVADSIEGGVASGTLRDVNGNRVGDFDAEDLAPTDEPETIDEAAVAAQELADSKPLAEWVAENRETLRAAVLASCSNAPTGDEDLAEWVAQDEGLYNWARADGVDV